MNATTAAEIAAFNSLTKAAFRHEPRSPSVLAECAYQRWFCADATRALFTRFTADTDQVGSEGGFQVYRSARKNKAQLKLIAEDGVANCEFSVNLAPDALRDLAARLIDAAYDIELWPAARLAAYDSLTDQVPA